MRTPSSALKKTTWMQYWRERKRLKRLKEDNEEEDAVVAYPRKVIFTKSEGDELFGLTKEYCKDLNIKYH